MKAEGAGEPEPEGAEVGKPSPKVGFGLSDALPPPPPPGGPNENDGLAGAAGVLAAGVLNKGEGAAVGPCCAGAGEGAGLGLLNENEGVEDTGGFDASVVLLAPAAKGELTVGALNDNLGAVEVPGRENAGGFDGVAAASDAGVNVILGTVGGAREACLSFSF